MKKREEMGKEFKFFGKSFAILSLLAVFVFAIGFPTLAKEEWGLPLEGEYEIVEEFGEKHDGIDLLVKEGSHAVAVTEGVVINLAGAFNIDGDRCWSPFPVPHLAIIDPNGYIINYKNLRDIFVKEGERVKAGQVLGTIGEVKEFGAGLLHISIFQETKDGNISTDPREFIKF